MYTEAEDQWTKEEVSLSSICQVCYCFKGPDKWGKSTDKDISKTRTGRNIKIKLKTTTEICKMRTPLKNGVNLGPEG